MATNSETLQAHVAIIIRIIERPDLAFLTHEGKHNSWFFPCGKVEEGESRLKAANRELREETGLDLPDGVVLREIETFELVQDGEAKGVVTIFAADVHMADFYYGPYGSFRSSTVARKMIKIVENQYDADNLALLENGTEQCLICEDIQAEFFDYNDDVHRQNKEDCFSFGQLVYLPKLKEALTEADEHSTWTHDFEGYEFRFTKSESPLWDKALELLENEHSLDDILKVTARPVNAEKSEGVPSAMSRHLPKMQEISGKNEKVLLQRLKGLEVQLTQRGFDLDSPDTVQFVAALFTDDLSEWWADSGSRLPINSITDLIQNIKGSFTLKDFEGENLKALMRVCQEGNTQQSLTGFIKAFNEYSNDWKNDITFRCLGKMFIQGLSDVNIRGEMQNLYRKEPFLTELHQDAKMPELQRLVTKAFINRTDCSADRRLKGKAQGESSNNGNKSADSSNGYNQQNKKKNGKRSRNSSNGGGRSQSQNGKGKKVQFSKDPDVEAAKKKLTQKEINECFSKGKCLICKKTGHLLKDCPDKK